MEDSEGGSWVEKKEAYLRVILLEDEETVHNAFFDRRYSKKGKNEDQLLYGYRYRTD